MTLGEIYVKLAVQFARDPKLRALVCRHGEEGLLARDLFVQMICYCRAELSDGRVPADELPLLEYPMPPDRVHNLAKHLVEHQLITVSGTDPEQRVYVVSAYVKRNGTRADVERSRQAKAAAGRIGGSVPRHAGRSKTKPPAKQLLSEPQAQKTRLASTPSQTETVTTGTANQDPYRTVPRANRNADSETITQHEEDSELLRLVADAVWTVTGREITSSQARAITGRLTAGRNVPNPRRQLVNQITTMTAADVAALIPHQPARAAPPPRPGTRQPPATPGQARKHAAELRDQMGWTRPASPDDDDDEETPF